MGTIGSSIGVMIPVDEGAELAYLQNRLPEASFAIRSHSADNWAVLAGDQVLFHAKSERECRDFVLGLIVGGSIFADLAAG